MDNFPKILIACPTAEVKDYCFTDWLDNVMSFSYPFYDVVMYDNTPDKGKYAKRLNKRYKERYGYDKEKKFKAYNSIVENNARGGIGVIERMAMSHNDCRKYALHHKYDFLLHLESDVFPPKDVIQELLFTKKKFVNALYYSDEGKYRRPMIQMHLEIAPNFGSSFWLNTINEPQFITGQTIRVALAGLGCALISSDVLKKIEFRYEKGVDKHPDTFFAEDCERFNIPIFLNTSIVCEHRNQNWGIYGIDYK